MISVLTNDDMVGDEGKTWNMTMRRSCEGAVITSFSITDYLKEVVMTLKMILIGMNKLMSEKGN